MNGNEANMFRHFEALKEMLAKLFDAIAVFDAGDIDDDASPVYFTWDGKHTSGENHVIELHFLNTKTKRECHGFKEYEEAIDDAKCICLFIFCYNADFDKPEYIKLKSFCKELFEDHKIVFRKKH